MDHMEDVPKILPVWQDYWRPIILQSSAYSRGSKHKFFADMLPDFGGFGAHVCSGLKGSDFTVAKHSTDQVIYGAEVCCLPFLPPKKVRLESDPCLLPINASNHAKKTFSCYLNRAKSYLEHSRKFKRKVTSLYSDVKNLQEERFKNCEEIPVPKCIFGAAQYVPESNQIQEGNFNYLGGCLVSSHTACRSPVLLHPTGRSLNKLGITPIIEDQSLNKAFQTTSPFYSSQKLKKTCIQKIRSNFAGHSFVQQDTFCYYVNFTNLSEINAYELNRKHGSYINIQTSPYSPVDFLSTDETGVLEVFDVESWKTSWHSDTPQNLQLKNPLLKDCSFGSHPKSVLLLMENSVHTYDLRSQNPKGSLLFSKHFSNFQWEKYFTMKCLASFNPFQSLILSTNHLYMIDERYPEKPVLIWNHSLGNSPFYLDVACYESNSLSSDAVVLLGSQESAATCLLSIKFSKSQFQPVSLMNPLYPSVTTDFCDTLRLHNIPLPDSLEKRIRNPLVGVSLQPHRQKKGFTCFQLSSYGDLFYQDFRDTFQGDKELTYSVGTGCVLTPPDKILPHISSWTDFFPNVTEKPQFHRKPSTDRIINMTEYLENTSSVSFGCDFCSYNSYSRDREAVLSSCCSSCGLSLVQYNDFNTQFRNLSLCCGASSEESSNLDCFDLASLEGLKSIKNKKVLKEWDSEVFQPNVDMDIGSPGNSCTSSLSSRRHSSVFQSIASFKGPDEDEPKADLSSSQEFTCDLVPPSQDVRPLIGETIRTSQAQFLNLADSFGGF